VPVEEITHEVLRADWLDFGAQPVDRVAMNAREEAPIAKLFLGASRRKAASQEHAFALESSRRDAYLARVEAQAAREDSRDALTDDIGVTSHDERHRFITSRADGGLGIELHRCVQPFRRRGERATPRLDEPRAPNASELVEPRAPPVLHGHDD